MPDSSVQGWSAGDDVRRYVPPFALVVAVVAVTGDPGTPLDLVLAAIPVAAFALWAYVPGVPLAATAVTVVAPVLVAQRSGQLEPLIFDASLLAFVGGRWAGSLAMAAFVGLLAAATPVLGALIQDPSELAVPVWLLGTTFPWLVGRVVAHQLQLAAELDASRRELAQQALLAERRRTARDVHDFVGHGLAAVMLQVTSARHVLRRDPAAAEEALRSAEAVGRESMKELRRTVALLRSEGDTGVAPPLPCATDVPGLVEQASGAGLAVEQRIRGDLGLVPPGVGTALYRVAQEALANAARHAPGARTSLELELSAGRVDLDVFTSGARRAPAAPEPGRSGYGLIGMRERVSALGGEFAAGPASGGWRVHASLPLEPAEDLVEEPR